jgi:DnaJ-class molecular chaperone
MPIIRTEYWAKPIPLRQFDWIAFYDNDEPNDSGGMSTGEGRTEQEAINDLLTNYPPPCVDCNGCGGILPGVECTTCEGTGERMPQDHLDQVTIVRSKR